MATVLAGASIAGATESPESSPLAPEGCSANEICVYNLPNYEARSIISYLCSGSGTKNVEAKKSATNRCGNKSDWLRTNGTVIACMNPGGNRPNPGTFNEVFIPVEFGAFC
jgi:hypothetical protein